MWSKSLQSLNMDATGNTGNSASTEPEDNRNHWLDRQRSDFDQRHVAAITFVYKTDYGIENWFARTIANGWTVTSILRMQSGQPFNITAGTDVNQDNVN